MKKVIATLTAASAAVLLIGAGAAVGAAVGAAYMYPASADNPTVSSGCVIRFDEKTGAGFTRPSIHVNAAHYCVGVERVYAEYPSGALVIEQQSAGPVVTIGVSPDETLVRRGISCGASGGISVTKVYCYDRGGKRVKVYSSAMYGPSANLWLSWTSWDRSAT